MRFAYDPTLYHIFFDDFDKYTAGDWTLTTVEAGAGSATEAIGNADGGVLVITNDAADDDSDFYQHAKESFKYVAGKRLHFKIRFKVSDAAQCDLVAGLQITDTTPLAVSDGIFFRKSDGDNTLQLVVCKNGTETVVDCHEMVTDTYVVAEFVYDGDDHIKAFIDGVSVARAALTNVPDDEELAISFGIQNGEAVAKIMSVDYVFALKER
jgi:hypothetical protein